MAYRYGLAAALAVLLASPGAAQEAAAGVPAPTAVPESAVPESAESDPPESGPPESGGSELPPGALPRPAPEVAGPPPRPEGFTTATEPQVAYDLFAMPEIAAGLGRMAALVDAGDPAGAAQVVDALAAAHPTVALLPANRAALAMLAGDHERAVADLRAAAALGYGDLPALLADPLFAALAADPRLAGLTPDPGSDTPPDPVPASLEGHVARVDGRNTRWDPATGWLTAHFDPDPPREGRVLGRQDSDAAYDRLRDLVREGRAAGNGGDLYDNRDRGHSALPAENHPQLSAVRYGPAARAADIDYGLNDRLLLDRPTFGNSSTALTAGPLWRSLPRYALTRADGAGPWRLWQAYGANQIYVYPSHKDLTAEMGDLFPANTPYMIVSEGSSGSDQPFLEAVAMILAAFRQDTKAKLIETGLLAPTVQFVFRRSQRSVLSRDDYMSGLAHPSAFSPYEIGLARMVSLANAIRPDTIPALVRLRVLEEDQPVEGIDYFGEGLSEQVFDTPAAIGRVWRGKDWSRSLLVSAADTEDPASNPDGRTLDFHWRLLRGDPDRVRIEPSADGRQARITIDWQEPRPVADESPVRSARVDIGVFAGNGAFDSAPAILSMLFPTHETRRYEPGPDGTPRIAMIDYADPAKAQVYADPMLMARADWRDDYAWEPDGRLAGWQRSRPGQPPEAFDAGGRRILSRDAGGRPAETRAVGYRLARTPDGMLAIEEITAEPEEPPGTSP